MSVYKTTPGCAWMSVVYRCVNKKQTMRKGTFFRAGQCAALSSFRVGKCYFIGKGYILYNVTKGCRSKRVLGVLIYYIGKGYFLTGHSERGINFKMFDTLFRVSFAVLCSRIGTQLTSKLPPGRTTDYS